MTNPGAHARIMAKQDSTQRLELILEGAK
jgi:hypothetical protein